MIEQALYKHLLEQASLAPFLARYNDKPAIFSQEAPPDTDELWDPGTQYGRIVFMEDIQGDPERTMGGTLAVDIMCSKEPNEDDEVFFPEDIEPIVRQLIHGWFFSNGSFTVAAQFKNLSRFEGPEEHVMGSTITFDLLAFPIMTTAIPDVIARINEWTANLPHIHVINYGCLPDTAWRPCHGESAVYWRCGPEVPAGWIPDTFQTIWRKTTVHGHIFAADISTMGAIARKIIYRLYAEKRLLKAGETPIMVNPKNSINFGADPLRTGQVTVEATYGVIVHLEPDQMLENIRYDHRT